MKEKMFEPSKPIYTFCPECGNKAWIVDQHDQHHGDSSVEIDGVILIREFITIEEETKLIPIIDQKPWTPSQEGRAKQDFGPKVSFLKQKVSVGNFSGFPRFAMSIFSRMQLECSDHLENFVPVEFCILEYTPERGSYIRPHYDDTWIWGDRLITLNLISETFLRLTREFNIPPFEIMIKMPPRSLLILKGEARYNWHHGIKKYDIKARRIALTWREFSEEIVKDEEYKDFVDEVFMISSQVNDIPTVDSSPVAGI